MYEWTELIKLWEQERLTPEQVIGQLLRYGQQVYSAEAELRRRLETLEQTMATFIVRDRASTTPAAKRSAGAV